MSDLFTPFVAYLKENEKTIVFTEGHDARIQEAASRLLAEKMMNVILLGDVEACSKSAAERGFDVSGATIIDPANYEESAAMIDLLYDIRKGKLAKEDCAKWITQSNYFGTMLLKMGKADCLVGGATYSTADTVRPALQIIKTKPGAHLVSSSMVLCRDFGEEHLKRIVMGDCALNIDYPDTLDRTTGEVTLSGPAKLAEVAIETAKTASIFGIDPKIAMLSFSTRGSGKGGTVALTCEATKIAQEMAPDLAIDGELQFDAAVAPEVASLKCGSSPVAGQANTFIFPNIESSNIGCKIAQRLGGYALYGPIMQGLNAPMNDLSRGCNADEVYAMALITACQK